MTDNNKKTHLIVTGRGGGGGTQVQADWSQTDSEQPDYIKNKPELATVATTGDYDDLTNKPTIPEAPVQSDWSQTDSTALDYIKNKPSIPSGQVQADWNQTDNAQVDYIKNKPTIPAAQVNSDWNSNSGVSQILNKPSLATVATSGNYSDLNGTPTLATVATSGDYDDLTNKPTIPVVPTNVSAFTNDAGYTTFDGDYNSLTNKPTIPAAQVNSDWNSNSGVSQILNKPSLATVATSGNYSDLNGTPSLATVATSGDYDDLQNKPTIPAAPVQSDWNEADSSSLAYIVNKPTIPTVPAMTTETLTFTMQGGTTKTVEFYTVPNYFYVEDISGSSNTLTITKVGSAPVFEVFKSTDRTNWTSMGTTSATITATIPANSKLYLKATTNQWGSGEWNYANIKASGNHNVGGNSMSLFYGDNFAGKTTFPNNSSYALVKLFNGDNKLVNANKLELPATTLTTGCCLSMFENCTALTTAPAVLAGTSVPVVAYYCMFKGCTALTTAPDILATAVSGNNACQQMFYGCTALTTAPTLLIKELKTYNNLCKEMFRGCISLNNITVYFNDVSGYDCLSFWVTGVAATGDFYNLGTASLPSGQHGIPSGWTVHTSL